MSSLQPIKMEILTDGAIYVFCLQNGLLLSDKCIPGLSTICYLVVLKNKTLRRKIYLASILIPRITLGKNNSETETYEGKKKALNNL